MKYFCNPININYRYQFNADPRRHGQLQICREAADPSLILFKGRYYIFASMTLGVWVSDDLVNWENRRLPVELPLYDYAPDVRVLGDWVYFCASAREHNCDRWRTKDMMQAVPGCPVVFHRAFDLVPDWRKGLETLIDLGVTRVLTSGQAPSAVHGIPVLREMIRFAQGAIEILPAAGIRPDNVRQIVEETGGTQVHLSGQSVRHDPSWPEKTPLWFSSPDAADGGAWRETDAELFRQIRLNLQPLEHKEE